MDYNEILRQAKAKAVPEVTFSTLITRPYVATTTNDEPIIMEKDNDPNVIVSQAEWNARSF